MPQAKINITVLCENETSSKNSKLCQSEWGLSLYIQINEKNILFDSGNTNLFFRNSRALGIDIEDSDLIVFSHHHWDHINGLSKHRFKEKKTLIAHPDVFDKISKAMFNYFNKEFKIIAAKKPLEVFDKIYFLGEIPRKMSFEKGTHKADLMLDDSALAIKTEKGTVVITGCSHSGICNICEYAKEITQQKLYAVIGGFHLSEDNAEVVDKTINYFKVEKTELLYPMHCVDFPTLVRFYNEFQMIKYGTGDKIII